MPDTSHPAASTLLRRFALFTLTLPLIGCGGTVDAPPAAIAAEPSEATEQPATEPVVAGAHRWLPNRNRAFAAVEDVPNWKDINPRVSVAYDLFGDGKTALKASASRGIQLLQGRAPRGSTGSASSVDQRRSTSPSRTSRRRVRSRAPRGRGHRPPPES